MLKQKGYFITLIKFFINPSISIACIISRYKIFKSILKEDEQIILAHHSDDVAETILMRILRGTGVEGIEGPKQKRNLGNGILIRPFLEITKKQILPKLRTT